MLAQRGCPGIPVKPGLKSGRIANDRHAILNVAKNGAGVISVKIDDELSFGAGLNGQYLDAKLTNAVDFGSVCLGTLGPSARQAISTSWAYSSTGAFNEALNYATKHTWRGARTTNAAGCWRS